MATPIVIWRSAQITLVGIALQVDFLQSWTEYVGTLTCRYRDLGGEALATGEVSDHPVIFLAYLPATSQQRRLVFFVATFLLIASAIAAPFADLPVRRFDSFIPSIAAIIFVNDLVTSVLLFAQYSIVPSRAMLVLAGGYLFTALIVIPHALTFPGAFTQTGLLGAGLQSTGWLYFFWHIGSPIAVLAYACLKDEIRPASVHENLHRRRRRCRPWGENSSVKPRPRSAFHPPKNARPTTTALPASGAKGWS
jgi:membrane-associated sensor protein